jgi:hypothetical protein
LERPHATARPTAGRTNGEPWVATPSNGTHPHQLPHRTHGIIHSGRPSNAPLPGWRAFASRHSQPSFPAQTSHTRPICSGSCC